MAVEDVFGCKGHSAITAVEKIENELVGWRVETAVKRVGWRTDELYSFSSYVAS